MRFATSVAFAIPHRVAMVPRAVRLVSSGQGEGAEEEEGEGGPHPDIQGEGAEGHTHTVDEGRGIND